MKTVLFVIDTLEVGGAEKSILEIASRFRSYKPVVCHIYQGSSLAEEYERNGIKVIGLNNKGPYRFGEAILKLRATVGEIKPDIIHSTLFRSDWVSRKIRRSHKIPLVNSLVNDSYSRDRYAKLSATGKLKLKIVELMDRFTADKADYFVSNSESNRISNASKLAINPARIKVIYRGRDIKSFDGGMEGYSLRKELQKNEDTLILLNVSRLLERKGQGDLILAFKAIADEFKKSILVIVGEGPYRPTLECIINESSLEGRVILLGTRNNIPSLLAQSDFFVFPSHYEGLPGALIEAMMAKKIIIASSIPENLECVNHESAYLFEKGNITQLAHTIRSTVLNPDPSKAETAYVQALRKFEINNIAAQYEKFYDSILRM